MCRQHILQLFDLISSLRYSCKHQRDVSGGKLRQIRVITSSPHEQLSPEVVSLLESHTKRKSAQVADVGKFSILWHPWHSICSEDLQQAGLAFSSGLNEDVPASQSVTKTDKSQSVLPSDGAQQRKEGNKAGLKIFYLEQKSLSRTGTNNFACQIWRQRAASNRILPHTAHDCRRTNSVWREELNYCKRPFIAASWDKQFHTFTASFCTKSFIICINM